MNGRKFLVWGLVIFGLVVALQFFELSSPGPKPAELNYSQFVDRIETGGVKTAEIDKAVVTGKLGDDTDYTTTIPEAVSYTHLTLPTKRIV